MAFITGIKLEYDVTLYFVDGLDEVISTVDVEGRWGPFKLNMYIPNQIKLADVKAILEKGKWLSAEDS